MIENKNINAIVNKMTLLQKAQLIIILEEILKKSEEPGLNLWDFRKSLQELIENIEESQTKTI